MLKKRSSRTKHLNAEQYIPRRPVAEEEEQDSTEEEEGRVIANEDPTMREKGAAIDGYVGEKSPLQSKQHTTSSQKQPPFQQQYPHAFSPSQQQSLSQMSPPEATSKKRAQSEANLNAPEPRKKKRKENGVDADSKPTSKQAAWYHTPFEVVPKFAKFLGQDMISRSDGNYIVLCR